MKDNGGSAFPQHGWSSDPETIERMQACGGMTLRDYFAAKAMEGIVGDRSHGRHPHVAMDAETFQNWAERAYAIADAMLKAKGGE